MNRYSNFDSMYDLWTLFFEIAEISDNYFVYIGNSQAICSDL